jgi:hypothetical protein
MKILSRLTVVAAAALILPLIGVTGAGVASAAAPKTPRIEVSVSPNPLVETGASFVEAVVQVEAVPGLAGATVNISSTQLNNTCADVDFFSIADGLGSIYDGNPIQVTLDNDGNATVWLNGGECAPGKDVIEADLVSAPYNSAETTLTVDSPVQTPRGVVGYPANEVETGTMGEGGDSDVYAVFYVETASKYAEDTAEIASNELYDRCGGGSEWLTDADTFADSATATATLDDNGNAVFVFLGVSCAAGTSDVIADIEAGLHPTYTNTYKIKSPRSTI